MMTLQRLPWLLWTKPPTKNDCRRDFGGGLPVRRAECIHLSSPSVQSPPHPTYHSMFFTDFWSLRRSFDLIHCHCMCHPIVTSWMGRKLMFTKRYSHITNSSRRSLSHLISIIRNKLCMSSVTARNKLQSEKINFGKNNL